MKHTRFFLSLLAVLFFLTGCNSAQMSSRPVKGNMTDPGPVIKDTPDKPDMNRIVTFTIKGKGVEPESSLTKGQARLMAERAAVADGYRQFVEKLQGVYVEAMMSAGYGTIDQDYVKTQTQSILRGVEIEKIIHGDYGIAEAVMSLRIRFTRQGMTWWPKGLGADLAYNNTASQ